MPNKFHRFWVVCIATSGFLLISSFALLADNSHHCGSSAAGIGEGIPMHCDDHHGPGDPGDDDPTPPPDDPPDEGDDPTPLPDDHDPTEEPTPEPRPRATDAPKEHGPREERPAPYLDLTSECSATGTTFVITNHGGDMPGVEPYTLSDGTQGEYQLGWKENKIIPAGFGAVSINAGAAGSLTVECQKPPELTITGVCLPESGVIYTIHNNGGPMLQPQVYTLDNSITDRFQLGEGGFVQIPAGFGDPVFFSEGLTTRMGTLCQPAGRINGFVWSDDDGNGLQDATESGLPDIPLTLVGTTGDSLTANTAANGWYEFEVVPGSYQLGVNLPDGFAQDLRLTADPDGVLDGTAAVPLDATDTAEWRGDFGYQPTRMGSISGLVWLETHDFGQHDADEGGLTGAIVHLLGADGQVIHTVTLQTDGYYEFPNLPPGLYSVQVDAARLPAQMFATYETDDQLDFITTIFLHPGETLREIAFGIVGPF